MHTCAPISTRIACTNHNALLYELVKTSLNMCGIVSACSRFLCLAKSILATVLIFYGRGTQILILWGKIVQSYFHQISVQNTHLLVRIITRHHVEIIARAYAHMQKRLQRVSNGSVYMCMNIYIYLQPITE